ncbi:TonB-dependent receptor [Luteimonas sp. M1R5S18]|uniref:TonB-dependent receptor n=2 Tax=Luteimonas rhizosphaericola TaxID=3042024 RepID=A0ABT6JH12_9GAMM|nr:TonB-dependent receptor [Luteimonas rhizosphaericola]MDH5829975.1 TonB-dependent receptor [Luteimonas rhizosphaericola]
MKLMPHTPGRTSLSAAIAFALTAMAALPATSFAQEAAGTPVDTEEATPATPDAATLDTVQVTGYRYAIEQSLEQKRNANAIVEVITAEDVSKFPDKNVADALQRVPGVVIERSGGEGKTVSVRGLQPGLTLTQLNGNYIASSETNNEATRAFNFVLMPSNLLASSELYKTPEARLEEGGIGGTVILNTRRPLDLPSDTGFMSIEYTRSDASDTTDPQASAMYSWHSEDERFGLLVGVTQQNRTNRAMDVSTESWNWYGDDYTANPATDVNGTPLAQDGIGYWWGESGHYDQNGNYYTDFFLPTSVNFGIRNEKRERTGAQLTAQFRPIDQLTLTGNYFRFELQGDYVYNQLKIPEWNIARFSGDGNWPTGRLLNGYTFDASGTIVTGAAFERLSGRAYYCSEDEAAAAGLPPGGWGPDDCTVPTPQISGGYSREQALSQSFDLSADWAISDLWKATFRGGRTWSEGGPSMNFRVSAKPRRRDASGIWIPGNTYSAWDLTGTPSATFSPNLQDVLMAGIAEIDTGSTDSSWMETEVEQKFFQADVTKQFLEGWLDSIQFGAKYTDGSVHRNTGNTYWVCQGADPADYDQRYQAGCDPQAGVAQPGFFYAQPLDNIAGGFNANVFPGIDFPAYIDYLNDRYGAMQNRREPDFIYNVGEKVSAGYMQVNFRTDRLRGNVGVRVARTRQRAESTDAVERFLDYFMDGPDGNPMPCPADGVPAGTTCESGFVRLPDSDPTVREKTFALAVLDRSYTDVLPSFNIAWDLTDTLVLRGAASKVISRPAYTQIAYPGALNFISEEYSNDRRVAGGTTEPGWYGSGSNKSLEPFEATQYDMGLEWYYQPGSVLGVGLFRKNIENFVIPVVQDQQIEVGGELVTVQDYSTNANGRDGVSQGAELYAQHSFDSGFGFQANYTYNDTNLASVVIDGEELAESPLVGSAKNQANLTFFYENEQFLARASYNRRGEMVGGLVNGFNVYSEPYDQVDVNLGYNFSNGLTLTGSVLNLTRSEQRVHLGNDTRDRFYSNAYAGRQYYLGLTYKF